MVNVVLWLFHLILLRAAAGNGVQVMEPPPPSSSVWSSDNIKHVPRESPALPARSGVWGRGATRTDTVVYANEY